MNKKGNIAYIWVSSLVIIFVLGVLFLVLSNPLSKLHDKLVVPEDFEDTNNRIYGAFKIWPLVLIFGVLLGAIIMSTKSSDRETGQGGFI